MRAVVIALVLVACGKDQPADPGGPAHIIEDRPGAKSDPATNAACKLVTIEDAVAMLGGRPLDEVEASTDANGNDHCAYKHRKPYGMVRVMRSKPGQGQAALDSVLKVKLLGDPPVEIPDVGTRALRQTNSFVVGVLANDGFAYAMAMTNDNAGPTPETTEALAKTIAGRL
jgi:hypothetical protein